MSGDLSIRNRQRSCRVDGRLFRRIVTDLLKTLFGDTACILGVNLVGEKEMTCLNETFLQHAGSTDIITFDYREPADAHAIHGELFICLPEARAQGHRYKTDWQSELTRYVIHGILHLRGYDDLQPRARQRMKREENRLLRLMTLRFPLRKLERNTGS